MPAPTCVTCTVTAYIQTSTPSKKLTRDQHAELQRLSLASSTQVKQSGKVDDFNNALRNKAQASELTTLGTNHLFERTLVPQGA